MANLSRTERDFQRALLDLLENHTFMSISVEQLCQEVMVHRSSFYRYYNDKYDLLKHTVNSKITTLIDSSHSTAEGLENVVDYLCQHKNLMRNLATSKSNSSLYPTMVNILADIVLNRYEDGVADPLVQLIGNFANPETAAYMLSASIVGAFYWWRDQDYATDKATIMQHAYDFINWLVNKSK